MQNFNSLSIVRLYRFHYFPSHPTKPFLSLFSYSTSTSTPNPNPLVTNYLIETLGFSKTRALLISNRFSWIKPESRLLCNIAFLESCGIVGSQLEMLLKRQPRLFMMKESQLRELVSRVLDMGFSIGSRMLVRAIYTVSCLSKETLRRKLDLLRSFQFSEDECMEMFRRAPALLMTSEEKWKLGIEFFLNTIKLKKIVLVHQPTCLMHSVEGRAIPRYKVLQIMKSKRLLKREPAFIAVLNLTEEEFLEKFISRFRDDAEELLVAYKGHMLDAAEE